jgi:hypothetical protein
MGSIAWCAELEQLLGWEQSLVGQHIAVGDTARCDGTFLLAYALQRWPKATLVCLMESEHHYRAVCRKLGAGSACDSVKFVTNLEQVVYNNNNDEKETCVVVIDSLYPLQMDGINVVETIRQIRRRLGSTGVLVTRMHQDCFEPRRIAYESDVLVSVREVASENVTGRLSVTRRNQAENNEMLFSIVGGGDSVSFKRI